MKKAFSLTEILILIFTIVVIAVILFPLNLIDRNQAQKIATWKSFYPQLEYSFDLMLKDDNSLIQTYKTDSKINGTEFFKEFLNYANFEEILKERKFFKYKHRYINGKKISKDSKYHADEFVKLKNGMILAFSEIDRTDDISLPIGYLFVDLDGKHSKNLIGKDVFAIKMYIDRLEPFGEDLSIQEMKEDCSPVGSGLSCAAYYLVGGSF